MIKRITIVFVLVCISLSVSAQSNLKKADAAFEKKSYYEAARLYKSVLDNTKDNAVIGYCYYQIAECYRMANKYNQALTWYKKAVDKRYKDPTNTMYYKYGDMLMMVGDYKLAQKMYKTHLTKNRNDEYVKMKIKSCIFADTVKSLESVYEVRNVQELNTKYNDFAAAACKDKVIFTSSRFSADSIRYSYTGDGFEDLYETFYNAASDIWFTPEKLKGGINTSFNDGTFSFDPNRNIAYYMQCNGPKGVEKNCNIYISEYNESENTWSKGKRFEHFSTSYSSGHPTISPDGNTLYFASNNPEGMGGTDIWMTKRDTETEKWSKPVNLGTPINTPFNEMFPYAFDDTGLYFSSDGHIGFGGLDMYYSEKLDTVFQTPVNLREPFNSSADDFGFLIIGGKSGFFTSNRQGGVGEDDLYYFKFKKIDIVASGRVLDKDSFQPIPEAMVVISNVHTGLSDTLLTDETGLYKYPYMEKDMEYKILTYKDEFLNPESKWISTHGITKNTYLDSLHGYDLNFSMRKIVAGKEYEIRDIYYDLDKYDLRPESVNELNNLISILTNNPDICIQINSHTDSRASDEYNIVLSHNRAKSVVDYLIAKGIDSKRLSWQGWGETRLVIPDAKNEEEHQANRRTTFTIVNVDQLHLGEKAVFHQQMVQRMTQSQSIADPGAQGVYFRVQIAAARSQCNANTFAKISQKYPQLETYCSQYPDGFYRYTVGFFTSFEAVESMKHKIDELGYSSFIVAFHNGQKISVNQAIRMLTVDTHEDEE